MANRNTTPTIEPSVDSNGAPAPKVEIPTFQLHEFANILIGLAGGFDASIKPARQFDSMVAFGNRIGASTSFADYREDILRNMGQIIAKAKHTRTGSRASVTVNFTEAVKELRIADEIKKVISGEIKFIGGMLTLLNATLTKEALNVD